MRTQTAALLLVASLVASCSHPQSPSQPAQPDKTAPRAAGDRGWIERSNQNAQLLLQVQAQFTPEFAARTGISGLDDRISDFAPGHAQRQREAIRQVQGE